MYPVPDAFHNLATADSPQTRCRIYFIPDSVDCTDDNDVVTNGTLLKYENADTDSNRRIADSGVVFHDMFNSDRNIVVGGTVSKQVQIALVNFDGGLNGFDFGRCKVFVDVYDSANSTWLTCPMGVYLIEQPEKLTTRIVNASGYDQMQYLNKVADAWWSNIDWSGGVTVATLISQIASECGVSVSSNLSSHILNGSNAYYEAPLTANQTTYRDILGWLGGVTGTIGYFDRDGALDMRWFKYATDETDTYTGNPVQFTGGSGDSLSSLTIPLSPIQSLNGYDKPWPAGGGVNLWPEYETQEVNGVTLTNDHGKVTINGTASADTYFDFTVSIDVAANEYIYIRAFNPSASSSNRLTLFVVTSSGNPQANLNNANASTNDVVTSARTITRLRIRVPSGVQYTNFVLYPYVQVGGTAPTAWVPYSNICPITGRTGVTVWDDPKYGGTIEWNQALDSTNALGSAYSKYGVTFTPVSGKFAYTTSGTYSYSSGDRNAYVFNMLAKDTLVAGHKYLVSNNSQYYCAYVYGAGTPSATVTGNIVNVSNQKGAIITCTGSGGFRVSLHGGTNIPNNTVMDETIYINLFDLTTMFGSGNEPTTVDAFKALFPADYYAYNAGTQTCVSAVNGDTYGKYEIDWTSEAGTVYGGSLDVVTGVLTVDRAMVVIDGVNNTVRNNGTTSTTSNAWFSGAVGKAYGRRNFISDRFSAGIGTVPGGMFGRDNSIGIEFLLPVDIPNNTPALNQWFADNPTQLCYELATPLTYQLTAQEVEVLVGRQNNVWSDANSTITVAVDRAVTINSDTLGNGVMALDLAEYTVGRIDMLEVLPADVDLTTAVGEGGNVYQIAGNPFLIGADDDAVNALATPIYNRLATVELYFPMTIRLITDWSLEAGDVIKVINGGTTYVLPIMQQTMTWRGGWVLSEMLSSGDPERLPMGWEERTAYQNDVQMHEFENTVNLLRSQIRDLSGNYTLIQQTVDSITNIVSGQGQTIQSILDPTGQIWTAITTNSTSLTTLEAALNSEISTRQSYIRFIPSEPAIVLGVDTGNEIKLKLVNNIIYFFNGADDSTDLSLAYAYFNNEEAGADRFVAKESVQIGNADTANMWLFKVLANGDLILDVI